LILWTTGVVALELGARFIGYDDDPAAYNTALGRLNGHFPTKVEAA
jgi:DNA modification methylase